jgi:hypothetical protein
MWRVCFLLLFLPVSVGAQEADAEARLAQGIELRRQGNDEEALARFTEAWEMSHAPRARAQMALAEQALGRWVDAERHLQEALAQQGDPWIEERRPLLQQAVTDIGTHLGSLEVRASVDGAEVIVDGNVVGTTPLAAVRLPIGTISLEVRAEGYVPIHRSVEVRAGLARETVSMVERPSEPSEAPEAAPQEPEPAEPRHAPEPAPVASRDPFWIAGAVALGAGVLAAGGGFVALGVREGHVQEFNSDRCLASGGTRYSMCAGAWDAGHLAEDLSIGLLVVGGAAAIAGAVLLGVGASTEDRSGVAISCAPLAGGLACAGRF